MRHSIRALVASAAALACLAAAAPASASVPPMPPTGTARTAIPAAVITATDSRWTPWDPDADGDQVQGRSHLGATFITDRRVSDYYVQLYVQKVPTPNPASAPWSGPTYGRILHIARPGTPATWGTEIAMNKLYAATHLWKIVITPYSSKFTAAPATVLIGATPTYVHVDWGCGFAGVAARAATHEIPDLLSTFIPGAGSATGKFITYVSRDALKGVALDTLSTATDSVIAAGADYAIGDPVAVDTQAGIWRDYLVERLKSTSTMHVHVPKHSSAAARAATRTLGVQVLARRVATGVHAGQIVLSYATAIKTVAEWNGVVKGYLDQCTVTY